MFWLYLLTLIFNPTLLPYAFACWWRHGDLGCCSQTVVLIKAVEKPCCSRTLTEAFSLMMSSQTTHIYRAWGEVEV